MSLDILSKGSRLLRITFPLYQYSPGKSLIMAEIASTLPPKRPERGTGALYIRVYGVTRDGVQYDIPPSPPTPGTCPVEGCDCGGPSR